MDRRLKNEQWGLVDDAMLGMDLKERIAYFRRRIWERDGGLCGICGRPVDLGPGMHLDHITMSCEGGEWLWYNLRIAHRYCNTHRPKPTCRDWRRLEKWNRLIASHPQPRLFGFPRIAGIRRQSY
jgi:hypothetical protein